MNARQSTQTVIAVGLIMAFRMLGLFMLLPIFSVAALSLSGHTPFLIGAAVGIYGLAQACLQIPFGALSDKIGRKPVIVFGLALFALGSIIAGMSHSIYGVIIGRGIQGMGAIGSTSLALVADMTRDENRTKAMATIGMIFGLSFGVAIILGPLLNSHFGLQGIFYFTAILAVFALFLVYTIPTPPKLSKNTNLPKQNFAAIFKRPDLMRLNFSIFTKHAIMSILFIALPPLLNLYVNPQGYHQALFYCVVLTFSFFAMIPFVINAEKNRRIKGTLLGAVIVLISSQLMLYTLSNNAIDIGIILFLFFTAFTLMESILPSLVSKLAPLSIKGAAMGVYSTSQFIGIAFGGAIGGIIWKYTSLNFLFLFNAALATIWLVYLLSLKKVTYTSTFIFKCQQTATNDNSYDKVINAIEGVKDYAIAAHEQLLYIKADKKIIDENKLRNALEKANLLVCENSKY